MTDKWWLVTVDYQDGPLSTIWPWRPTRQWHLTHPQDSDIRLSRKIIRNTSVFSNTWTVWHVMECGAYIPPLQYTGLTIPVKQSLTMSLESALITSKLKALMVIHPPPFDGLFMECTISLSFLKLAIFFFWKTRRSFLFSTCNIYIHSFLCFGLF